jgi:hypothetical protein
MKAPWINFPLFNESRWCAVGGKSEESVAIFNIKERTKKQGEGVITHCSDGPSGGKKLEHNFLMSR